MDAPHVTLRANCSATLERPSTLATIALSREREALRANGNTLLIALGAAALYLSWPINRAWPTRPRPRPWRVGQDIESWGHGLFDQLADAGVSLGAGDDGDGLIHACGVAYDWAARSLLREGEVEAAANFSEAPTGG